VGCLGAVPSFPGSFRFPSRLIKEKDCTFFRFCCPFSQSGVVEGVTLPLITRFFKGDQMVDASGGNFAFDFPAS